jgi:hypothetical protein
MGNADHHDFQHLKCPEVIFSADDELGSQEAYSQEEALR